MNKNLVPGFTSSLMEEIDGDSRVTSSQEVQSKIYPNENGELQSEIIRVIENGKDITEKRKAGDKKQQQKEEQKKEVGFSIKLDDCNPFAGELQNAVEMKPVKFQNIETKRCLIYEYTLQKNDIKYKGQAWLEDTTGVPVAVEFTSEPLPKYVNKLRTTVLYDYDSKGLWFPKEVKVEGSGGFLFIKKNVRAKIILGDYWYYSGIK